ncbi:hypothetical protein E2562_026784 [Oryza meyeriana var. granulata]|uniref:Uncharacterized protein n=1 Tax=Oryza meyeriana var. granulata TaxID=110450 RepID=A0A6G1CTC1_9ORYZ|nr:hypothetical protein E2562_026784 [Oryza meyeriana var. granulata]
MEELSNEEKVKSFGVFKDSQNREIFMIAGHVTRLMWIDTKCNGKRGFSEAEQALKGIDEEIDGGVKGSKSPPSIRWNSWLGGRFDGEDSGGDWPVWVERREVGDDRQAPPVSCYSTGTARLAARLRTCAVGPTQGGSRETGRTGQLAS